MKSKFIKINNSKLKEHLDAAITKYGYRRAYTAVAHAILNCYQFGYCGVLKDDGAYDIFRDVVIFSEFKFVKKIPSQSPEQSYFIVDAKIIKEIIEEVEE